LQTQSVFNLYVISEIMLGVLSEITLGVLSGLQGGRRLAVWWYDEVKELKDLLGGLNCSRFGFLPSNFRLCRRFSSKLDDPIDFQHFDPDASLFNSFQKKVSD
jgi:hypothetical protein